MIDPAESFVSSDRSSKLRTVALAIGLAGIVGAGIWLLTRGKGADEDPARVLIVGPTPELEKFLEDAGFDASQLSLGEAIGEGQALDSSLDDLPAMLEYADHSGFGYLALNVAHGQRYDLSPLDVDVAEPPLGTTFMVVSVGDLGTHVTYGGAVPEIVHEPPSAERVGLLLGLFAQPEIAKARTGDGSNDLLIRFGAADTLEDVVAYEKAQASMGRQIAAWRALAERERGSQDVIELARPYEPLRAWPLANGSLLLAAGRDALRSPDGLSSKWAGDDPEATFFVVALDAPQTRIACTTLPDTLPLDGGFSVAPAGDAMLIPSDAWIAHSWVLTGPDCSFEQRDPIRRLDGGALGVPRASGRTAASAGGRLMWAHAKMRSHRSVELDGVALRGDALHWLDDELLVVPANLDFAAAAQARADRMALAADPSGATMSAPIDPATQPLPTEALVFVELPPPEITDQLHTSVVPIAALLPSDLASAGATIRAVSPLAEPSNVAVIVDGPAGPRLLRATIDRASPWPNALAVDYSLAQASEAGKSSIEIEPLASLPVEIEDVAISPDLRHVAWATPSDRSEIVLLSLGGAAEPTRLTDNDRRDARPRFIGGQLIFDSTYAPNDELPAIEAVHALELP